MESGTTDERKRRPLLPVQVFLVKQVRSKFNLFFPIINGRSDAERINQVLTFGGQSLKGSANSIAFLRLSDTAKTLFRYPARQVEISAANRAQGIALKYGKGRVVVTGEAGMLSAQILKEGQASYPFGMNVPGFDNRQLALNIMHWLSGLLR